MERATRINRPMALDEALRVACQSTGRSVADVHRAEFVSEMQIRSVEAERGKPFSNPVARQPHWAIRFCEHEYLEDDRHVVSGDPDGWLLVFADGRVVTYDEVVGDEP